MSKDIFDIKDDIAYNDFRAFIEEDKPSIIRARDGIIETDEYIFEVSEEYYDLIEDLNDSGILPSEALKFDISSYVTNTIENQGYTFKTF